MANDYLSLFIADINRSFEGLIFSIEQSTPSTTQASLHARDLADALGSVGLSQLSSFTADLSRQLATGQDAVLPATTQLIEFLKIAIPVMESGNDNILLPNQIEEIHRLSAQMLAAMPLHLMPAFEPTGTELDLPTKSDLDIHQEIQQDIPVSGPAANVITSVAPNADFLLSQRRMGLNLVQRVRKMVSDQQGNAQREIDFLLSEHQDALLAVGQVQLAPYLQNFTGKVEADGVLVDSDLADVLVSSLRLLAHPGAISVHKQALTLFINLSEISVTPLQLSAAGEVLAKACGRIEYTNGVLRILLPASLKRMRLLPFMRNGQRYVVSWAQLISIDPVQPGVFLNDVLGDASQCQKTMRLCCGDHIYFLNADEIYPVLNMNTFKLPSLLSGPDWLSGIALDDASNPYSWVLL